MAGKAEYKNQWQKENCDRVNLILSKGRKDEIKAHADARGESVNGFINRAIDETMQRDGCAQSGAAGETAGGISLPPDTLKTAQTAAQAAGEAVPAFITRAVETQAKRDKITQGMIK